MFCPVYVSEVAASRYWLIFFLTSIVYRGSYTTVKSIDVITEGVETLKGFRGPLTAEIAADLKWLHISVEESYMTKVICEFYH